MGDWLIRAVRELSKQVGIIIVTGSPSIDGAIVGIRSAVSDYIKKPLNVLEVTNAVTKTLHQVRGRHQLLDFRDEIGE